VSQIGVDSGAYDLTSLNFGKQVTDTYLQLIGNHM